MYGARADVAVVARVRGGPRPAAHPPPALMRGRAAVAVLTLAVTGAVTAAAVYPVFIATERPAGERPVAPKDKLQKKSACCAPLPNTTLTQRFAAGMWGEMKGK